jgi:hypothetical protein
MKPGKYLPWLIIAVLLVLIFLMECGIQRRRDRHLKEVVHYSDSAQHYKGLHGAQVAYNQSLELQSDRQLRAVLEKYDTLSHALESFRNIESAVIIRETTIIKHDTVNFEVQIPCDFEPFRVSFDSAHYQLSQTVARNFITIDSLVIPNRQSIILGEKRLGFLKGTERRVEVINSNPMINTTGLGSYVISGRKKWYQTRIFAGALGVVVGALALSRIGK